MAATNVADLRRVTEVTTVYTDDEANRLLENGNWTLLAAGVHPDAPGPVFILAAPRLDTEYEAVVEAAHNRLKKSALEAMWWMERAHEPDDEAQTKEQYRLKILDDLRAALDTEEEGVDG